MPFLNPLFLFALAAVGIPVALHLLNRRNPKPVPYSTLRFLQAAIAKTRKSRHLTQLLTLLLRILIIALLALAFARPTLRSAAWLPEGPRTVVIMLDASASMQCRSLDTTHFEQARNWALDLLATLGEQDRVAFVVSGAADGNGRVIFPPITNHGLVAKAIREAACGAARADLVQDLTGLVRELGAKPGTGAVEIHLFSDFQRTAWPAAQAADLAPLLQEHDLRFFANRVGSGAANAWIEEADIQPEAILGGGDIRVTGAIRAGEGFTGTTNLRLVVDERQEALVAVPLAPGTAPRFALAGAVRGSGQFASGHLAIDDDALTLDNTSWFALARQENVKVLLVNGTEAAVDFQADTWYLRRALNPQAIDNPLILCEVVAWTTFLERLGNDANSLAAYQAVMIANPPPFDANLAVKLEQYAGDGGTVIFYPGEARGLTAGFSQLSALKALSLTVEQFPTTRAFTFLDNPQPDVLERRTANLVRVKAKASGKARLAIGVPDEVEHSRFYQFDSETPVAVRIPYGGGAFWVSALTANRDWSDWPLSPNFVIFHQLLVRQSFSNQRRTSRIQVGDVAEIAWPGDEKRLAGEVVAPDGKATRFAVERAARQQPFVLGGFAEPGLYRVELQTDAGPALRHVAVNVAPAESDLVEIGDEELAGSLAPVTVFQSRNRADLDRQVAGLTTGHPLWPWLLLFAFLLGIGEELFANIRSWSQAIPDTMKQLLRGRRP